jgi:hypothetical protein
VYVPRAYDRVSLYFQNENFHFRTVRTHWPRVKHVRFWPMTAMIDVVIAYVPMNTIPYSRIPESASQADSVSYDCWFRAKMEEAINSIQTRIPHEEAVARVDALLEEKRKARARG